MSKQWYAVCDKETGELKSTGTVPPDRIGPDCEVIELAAPVDFAVHAWDAGKRQIVARVPRPKPLTVHTVLDRLTAEDMATTLQKLGLSPARASELTAP